MAGSLTLRVIAPDHIALDTEVSSVKIPATDGSIGILPRHAHMVAALDVGVLTYVSGGKEHDLFVSGGFAEVRGGTVRVVSEAGEKPEEIDLERAAEAERRARRRIDEVRGPGSSDIDVLRAEFALRRALLRQRVQRGSR